MIEFLLINKVLIFLINAVALWLAFLVYHNNPKREINKLFILMTVSMLLWVNFAFLARYVGQGQIYQSLLFIKIAWFVTPLLFLFLSLVAVYIIKEEKKYRLLNKIVLFLGVIAAFITGFTNLVIKGIKFENGNLIVVYGKGMMPFLAAVMFLMYTTLYPLFKKYFKSLEEEKKKIEFFLIGIFIFYLANIIFNIARIFIRTIPILILLQIIPTHGIVFIEKREKIENIRIIIVQIGNNFQAEKIRFYKYVARRVFSFFEISADFSLP